MTELTTLKNVIFFDGYCGLCNGFVDFIMKIDKDKKFLFSPLQSEYAKRVLPPEFTEDLKTVVVQMYGKNYKKAEAVFAVFYELGGKWKALATLKILPKRFLNLGYDMVASTRYQIFGKRQSCRLPTPAERQRFVL